ncbi:MAG: hypothetical protein ACK4MF_04325 [Hyphomicrobiaceae bacterium]
MNALLGALALVIGVLLLALHSKRLVAVVAAAWSRGQRDGASGGVAQNRPPLVVFAIARSVFWLAAALVLMGWGMIRLGLA